VAIERVAVLGTGIMGAPMAANIARAGIATAVWNRTRSAAEPLADAGARVCDEATEAAAGADAVLTMLFDADVTAEVMADVLPAMADGAIWIQSATVGVDGCEKLSRLAADHGVTFVDAPVLGTRQPAENAQLVVLASGPDEARPTCQPLFEAIGSVRRWLGAAGAGSRLKVVVNSWVLTVMGGTATCVALSERLGLEPRLFLEMIEGGTLDCQYAHIKADAMVSRSLAPNFKLKGAVKDASLAIEAAGNGPPLGTLQGIRDDMQRAVEEGHGDEDMAALYFALVDGAGG
jgi:3-hydroxyisobutyrate dehydrogenase